MDRLILLTWYIHKAFFGIVMTAMAGFVRAAPPNCHPIARAIHRFRIGRCEKSGLRDTPSTRSMNPKRGLPAAVLAWSMKFSREQGSALGAYEADLRPEDQGGRKKSQDELEFA